MRASTRILRAALADLDDLEEAGHREAAESDADKLALARQLREIDREREDIHDALDQLEPGWLDGWAPEAQDDLFGVAA